MDYQRPLPPASLSLAPIGIFDSGVGGISILKAIQQRLPHENLIYIADSLNAPYGDKPVSFIQQQSLKLARFLLSKNIKVLVIACNTATTEAISHVRQHLTIPIVGVEPAIKPAAELSSTKTIGILATHRTIHSQRLQELIDLHATDATLISVACPGLVEVVEEGLYESTSGVTSTHRLNTAEHPENLLRQFLQPMLEQQADTIILGCTHYPFLLPQIKKIVGNNVNILDTGKPVATQLERILQQNGIRNPSNQTASITFYSSLDCEKHRHTIYQLWGKTIHIKVMSVNEMPVENT